MIEPLYVDEARLDGYYSQLVTKPKVRRVPTYTISAGISPSVGLQGAVTQIPAGLAEKLETVCAHLGGQEILGLARPSIDDSWDNALPDPSLPDADWRELRRTFRRETCEVRSVLLPPPADGSRESGTALWVSDRPLEQVISAGRRRKIGALYLIPEFPHSDGPAHYVSGVSLLQMLYSLDLDRIASGLREMRGDGAARPFGLRELVRSGRLGPPKMVDVLYRIRGSYLDRHDGFRVTTIAYPIVMLRA
ncbi:hypothetical protein ABJI51_12410 [Amycolatopsis sp. NEAU-NG30]|uniref:Uncharacterized protein n=1 Tax=Amycolatopsis melonis TaxID=3156488 RepID=A0ABV0LC66_9PSEU